MLWWWCGAMVATKKATSDDDDNGESFYKIILVFRGILWPQNLLNEHIYVPLPSVTVIINATSSQDHPFCLSAVSTRSTVCNKHNAPLVFPYSWIQCGVVTTRSIFSKLLTTDTPYLTGQWRGALMFSLIWAWMNGWVNIREAGDLRRHRADYDVTVMIGCLLWVQGMIYVPALSLQ